MSTNSRLFKNRFLAGVLCVTFTAVFVVGEAPLARAESHAGGFSAMKNLQDATNPLQSFHTDLFTGRAVAQIQVVAPPGRRSMTPDVALTYNSSAPNSWTGIGWTLETGFIGRDTKKGTPTYDNALDTFIFAFKGVSSKLVSIGSNHYRARDEALFLDFEYLPTDDAWLVRDKSGTKHWFGQDSGSRLTGDGMANGLTRAGTYKWMLSRVEDTLANYMTYSYTADAGELYPLEIAFNGNAAQNFLPTHFIRFTLSGRTDSVITYRSGKRCETRLKLTEVGVWVKDQLSRKYVFDYDVSGSTRRSCISRVTEFGKDGLTSLPPTTFSYQQKTNGCDLPINVSGVGADSQGKRALNHVSSRGETVSDLVDMDGDGYLDRVMAQDWNSSWQFQKGSASGFAAPTSWSGVANPYSLTAHSYPRFVSDTGETQVDLVDMTGDGLPDRLVSQNTGAPWTIQKNTGSGFGAAESFGPIDSAGYSPRENYIRWTSGGDTVVDLIDLTGDGLPDRVVSTGGAYWRVSPNLGGGGFGNPITWGPIQSISDIRRSRGDSSGGSQVEVDLLDMSGDGLPDRLLPGSQVQFSNGHGFETATSFAEETGFSIARHLTNAGEASLLMMDLDADGLPDMVQASDWNSSWQVSFNTGKGFKSPQSWGPVQLLEGSIRYSYPAYFSEGETVIDVMDLDGDGMSDRLQSNSSRWTCQANKRPFPDLLSSIDNGQGGKTLIQYKQSTQLVNTDTSGRPRLPFNIWVVDKVNQEDGLGNSYATDYLYVGGLFDPVEREFWGFRQVTVTDPEDNKKIHYFGQDDHLRGKLLEEKAKDKNGNLFVWKFTTWLDSHPYLGVHFVYVEREKTRLYDGQTTYKEIRTRYAYDAYGNLATVFEDGDVSVTTDDRKTINAYTYNATPYILNTLARTELYHVSGSTSTLKARRTFLYDGQTSKIFEPPAKALLTRERETLLSTGKFMVTDMAYDGFGNVTTIADARGFVTTNQYDAEFKLFLTRTTNAMGRSVSFSYDPALAQITSSTDQNGQTTQTVYDALGRKRQVFSPLDTDGAASQEFAYDLGLQDRGRVYNRTVARLKASFPGTPAEYLTTYSFADGLGRTLQTRSAAENPTQQIVTGSVTFTVRGQVQAETVPLLASFSQLYEPASAEAPKASFEYDSLGRRTKVIFPDGTVSQAIYNQLERSSIDPNGHRKDYVQDGLGRVTLVREHMEVGIQETRYSYDALDNLTATTDALGNVTQIAYDSLSRKTSMTDPDMGTWSYVYDQNDNLTKQTDARGNTVEYVYDALNRVTQKKVNGQVSVTYTYDNPAVAFSLGRLTQAVGPNDSATFRYDALGRTIETTRLVDGHGYTFSQTYDALGRVRTRTFPDSDVLSFTFNLMGEVETITLGARPIVTGVSYNASGQITRLELGNGTFTDYSYSPLTLRLEHLFTQGPTGILQDLSYTFDPVGNVLSIRDAVYTGTQNFQYDALDRLISSTGASYGTQTYQYDAIGNMLRKGTKTFTYGTLGTKPHAVTSEFDSLTSQSRTFSYDPTGNMTQRSTDLLTYDAENRMASVTAALAGGGVQAYNYTYGFDGSRLKRTSQLEATIYLADDYELRGSLTIKAVFLGQQRVAELEAGGAGEEIRFFHSDHLGSSNVTTNELGQVISVMEFAPYGEASRSDGDRPTHTFTGQEEDLENLLNFNARAYDPELGRFLQADPYVQDPLDPQTLNRYAYARNNPIRFTDPSGNFIFEWIAIIAAVVAAAAKVGQLIAQATGHERAAKVFGRISAIASLVAVVAIAGTAIQAATAEGSIKLALPKIGDVVKAGAEAASEAGINPIAVARLAGEIVLVVQVAEAAARHIEKQLRSAVSEVDPTVVSGPAGKALEHGALNANRSIYRATAQFVLGVGTVASGARTGSVASIRLGLSLTTLSVVDLVQSFHSSAYQVKVERDPRRLMAQALTINSSPELKADAMKVADLVGQAQSLRPEGINDPLSILKIAATVAKSLRIIRESIHEITSDMRVSR